MSALYGAHDHMIWFSLISTKKSQPLLVTEIIIKTGSKQCCYVNTARISYKIPTSASVSRTARSPKLTSEKISIYRPVSAPGDVR